MASFSLVIEESSSVPLVPPGDGHPLHGVSTITIDWLTGDVGLVSSEEAVVSTLDLPAMPDRAIVGCTFRVDGSLLVLTLASGAQATIEIGRVISAADRPIVYLDQLHWVHLAQVLHGSDKAPASEVSAAERLIELATDGRSSCRCRARTSSKRGTLRVIDGCISPRQ